ncbi:hypothetical protein CFK37_00350 [Virgibacillus phasianinus]|uniref:Uncharacterized protein n=1 Tax=Virgibacillus phasianinus TaxID=2017483 RepID=A0A220TYD3_9BACI|nr:hypothetical protein [Virgibacillus phasianinus]ASK60765.1 hypothetical protein CFK37_00350 [Virgibacillus phasianinus]
MSYYDPSRRSFGHPYEHYYQNQGWNGQREGYRQNGNNGDHGTGMESETHGGMPGPSMYPDMEQDAIQDYPPYPSMPYSGTPDMQSMGRMMMNIENQLTRLNQLIAQNNQLLQSMHDQEDTKCVQGSGGGAVIVRM